MEECIHLLPLGQCTICGTPATSRQVYVTGGGSCYHLRKDCSALGEGQRKVELRGGDPDVVQVRRLSEVRHTRRPCRVCASGQT